MIYIFAESKTWEHSKDVIGVTVTMTRVRAMSRKRAIKKLPRPTPGRYWMFIKEES